MRGGAAAKIERSTYTPRASVAGSVFLWPSTVIAAFADVYPFIDGAVANTA